MTHVKPDESPAGSALAGCSTEAANTALRERLTRLVAPTYDVVITHIEVNEKHGVGVLTRRIFGAGANVLSVRSQDHFGGEQDFGRHRFRLSHMDSRPAVYGNVLAALQGLTPRRIVCIPYYPDDVRTAVALKDMYAVPMCTYLMDDQNVFSDGIPDELMRELLAKSELRLAISSELRVAYERKFRLRFWVLPPVVEGELIQSRPEMPTPAALQARNGVIVGNIWGKTWFERLRATVRGTGVKLDWYCNSGFRWKTWDIDELAVDGIQAHGALSDKDLVAVLRKRPFVVLPSGTLDESDDRRFIARLSLPSRIPYISATSNTPIIVLGHEQTAAARFVAEFGIGIVCSYGRASFLQAVESVIDPEVQTRIRRRAAKMATRFSVDGVCDWIWRSLEARAAVDDRFEKLLAKIP